MASRERVKRLNKVDLPTLGRPTSAMTGFMMFLSKVLISDSNAKRLSCCCIRVRQASFQAGLSIHLFWCDRLSNYFGKKSSFLLSESFSTFAEAPCASVSLMASSSAARAPAMSFLAMRTSDFLFAKAAANSD